MGATQKRVLVTGGAGFIGSHTVDLLMAKGHSVTVIDSLVTGRLANLEQHRGNPRFRLIQADINDVNATRHAYVEAQWVVHLAALADIVPSIERPLDYFHANVSGTANVLELARANGVERLVYSASASCYGVGDQIPTPETAPIQPVYPYALTKWMGESMVLHWGKVYDLPVVSLRFFNAYGPRSRTSGTYGAVMGVFLAQKLKGQPFTVVGDGNQLRDFTYVEDIADAIVRSLESDVKGEVLNIGAGAPQSINRLVELIGGPKIGIPKRPGEPDITFADIQKIRRLLGWSPKTSFEEGVKKVVEQIDLWKDAPVWTPESIQKATQQWFDHLAK